MVKFKLQLITGLLIFIFTPLWALAGPPIVTDDAGTPGPGKWEINTGVALDKRRNETAYQTPALDLNYGIGEHIQLNYSVSWIAFHTPVEGTKTGLSNSEAAVKWRFLDEDRQGIAMSVYPRFIFNNPTSSADRGIVDKGTVFRLPLQAEKKIGIITVNPELGHDFHQEGNDEWIYGLALKYAEIKGMEVLTEIFGTADSRFKKQENAVDIGVRKDVNENVSLHASVGRSLRQSPEQPSLLSYVGLQMRF